MNIEDDRANDHGESTKIPSGPLFVRDGCWQVGQRNPASLLQCNTYVRQFESGSSLLNVWVDPGSMIDFPVIRENLDQLVGGVAEIRAFSVNHQDPDVVGNAIHLLQANPDVSLMVTEDVWRLLQHMLAKPKRLEFANPVASEMKILDSGERWKLVPTPFCHFRGAMAFYDRELQTLFSGDLFGGLNRPGRVQLFAEESDWDGISQFHQIYMPSRESLRYAVEQIRALTPRVKVIAPQHGFVIKGSLVELFLDRMYDLLVGEDLRALELDESYLDGYRHALYRVLAHARTTLGRNEVLRRLSAQVDDGLSSMIRIRGRDVHLDHEGYSAIVKAVARLAFGQPLEVVNALRNEVLEACTERGLPIPPIGTGLEQGLPSGFMEVGEMDLPTADRAGNRPRKRNR